MDQSSISLDLFIILKSIFSNFMVTIILMVSNILNMGLIESYLK